MRRKRLCTTLAGNEVVQLIISDPDQKSGSDGRKKRGVVISSRVHPGETNSSWMLKGALDFITGESSEAKALRSNFVFKIVPMLNPDGVVVGNYRCSLSGEDLNRQYANPTKECFPEVYHLKQMIMNFKLTHDIVLFADLHGHSRKSNIFMYGCENLTNEELYMKERIIPTLLDESNPCFNIKNCSFQVSKGKEGCGRVVVNRQLGISNSYTMEASFMGADQGELKGVHFNTSHYESMGRTLCEVLKNLCDPTQSKMDKIHANLLKLYPMDASMIESMGIVSDNGTDSESDSSASAAALDLALPSQPKVKAAVAAFKAGGKKGKASPTPPASGGKLEGGGWSKVKERLSLRLKKVNPSGSKAPAHKAASQGTSKAQASPKSGATAGAKEGEDAAPRRPTLRQLLSPKRKALGGAKEGEGAAPRRSTLRQLLSPKSKTKAVQKGAKEDKKPGGAAAPALKLPGMGGKSTKVAGQVPVAPSTARTTTKVKGKTATTRPTARTSRSTPSPRPAKIKIARNS
ncbi:unnamed protein product [Chrysoparadoxa australica]